MSNEFPWFEHFATGASAGLVIVAWLARNKIIGLFNGKKTPEYIHGEHTDRRADKDYTCVFHEKFEEEVEQMQKDTKAQDKETKRISDTQIGVVIQLEGLIKSVDGRFDSMSKLQAERHRETTETLNAVQKTLLQLLTK